jgi:hypothetical protein
MTKLNPPSMIQSSDGAACYHCCKVPETMLALCWYCQHACTH